MSLQDFVDAMFEPHYLCNARPNVKNTLAQYHKQLWRGPFVDLYPVEGGVELQADLPGMDKESINLTIEKDVLTLSGERKDSREIENERFHYTERRFGNFSRTIKLPFSADPATVSAKFDNGVLTVRLPQPEATKAGVIAIE